MSFPVSAGGSDKDIGIEISSITNDSSIVTGYFYESAIFGDTVLTSAGESDIFIAKLDAKGSYLWAKQAGGTSYDLGESVTLLSDGSSIVTGFFFGATATFGSTTLTSVGGKDIFVAKLDSNGDYLWAKQAGGSGYDTGFDITSLNDGSSIVTGEFEGTATFGSTTLTSAGFMDAFITKLDADGNFLWTTQASGVNASQNIGRSVTSQTDGSSFITGYFNESATFGSTTLTSVGGKDIFIAKLDSNGDYLWAKQAGGISYDYGFDITSLSDGSSIVTGYFYDSAIFGSTTITSTGEKDVFVAKLDSDGNFLWAAQAGGSSTDFGYGISALNNGSSIVTGSFEGSATFGSTTLTSAGGTDTFIAKLDASGNWIDTTSTPTPSPSPSPEPTPESFQTVDGFTQFTDVADSLIGQSNIKFRMMGGNDLLEVIGGVDNFANGNRDEDKIILSGGQGRYLGGSDNDIFEVYAAEDGTSVNGNRGDDTIIGSVSGVIYRGGKDNDTLAVSQGEAWGDLGVDVFRGVTGEGYAVIQDYTIGEDIIDLTMDGVWSNIDSGLMFTDDSGDQIMLLVGINNVQQVVTIDGSSVGGGGGRVG